MSKGHNQSFELNADRIEGFSGGVQGLKGALANYGIDLPDPACAEAFFAALVAFVVSGGLDRDTVKYLKSEIRPEKFDSSKDLEIGYNRTGPKPN